MKIALGWMAVGALLWGGSALGQECVTCWAPRCGDAMKSYLPACESKPKAVRRKPAARRKKQAAPSGPQPGETKREPKTDMKLAWIPGGTFTMGCEEGDSHCSDDEKPAHREQVDGFWLGQTDVTVAEYEKCVNAGECSLPSTRSETNTCNWGRRRNHPVNCVDWNQAVAFCKWVGGRLPTTTEWEYAAKGGEHRIYPWGNDPLSGKHANYCDVNCPNALNPTDKEKWEKNGWVDKSRDDGWAGTSPVASYPAGKSKWGLWDMAGNVRQWTDTDYDSKDKELRGGGWYDDELAVRASSRIHFAPSTRADGIGFRCAQ